MGLDGFWGGGFREGQLGGGAGGAIWRGGGHAPKAKRW